MRLLQDCFVANRKWAADTVAEDPDFFTRALNIHKPDLLWIGCSDARLPPNEIIGRRTGELFVHRNVANLVVHSDLNALSVLQYAIEVLGGRLEQVIRTRTYVTDISQWEEVARVHGSVFKDIRPATTIVEVSRLIDDAALIEIEADAIVA